MVGSKIKEYLDNNGIKQTFLAKETGISDSRISKILNQGVSIDCVDYYRICKALNVPLGSFLEGCDQ
jgi:transcriptional regulator with XRE-family HTH domain